MQPLTTTSICCMGSWATRRRQPSIWNSTSASSSTTMRRIGPGGWRAKNTPRPIMRRRPSSSTPFTPLPLSTATGRRLAANNMHYRIGLLSAATLLATMLPIVPTVAGVGKAAEPLYLLGIAADSAGKVFLADRELPGVWQLADGKLSLYFQGSKKFRTPLNAVRCLAIDQQGKLLAGDSATREVYRFGDDKMPVPLSQGGIGIPMSIGALKSGDLLVADLEVHRIFKVPAAGGQPTVFAEVPAPRALTIDKDDRVWVVSHGKDQVLRSTAEGKFEIAVSGRPFEFPSAIVVD